MAGLVLKDIAKSFDDTLVLENISLELGAGELLVLLGPSGCGKSTLLRIIAGLEDPDAGEVFIDNRRVDTVKARDRNVALVFQNYSLYPHMSIEKNLAFPLKVAKVPRFEIKERVQSVADMLGLGDRLKDKPGQLSGGQRQRVALGRAIIRDPSIFLLDEPLSNLDAELRVRMRREIVRIQREVGKTMVHVTHDQEEALSMADRIALLNDGHLVQLGTPEELYSAPATKFVAGFIGSPQINMFEAEVKDGRLIPFGSETPEIVSQHERLTVGLRPEAIEIAGTGPFEGKVVASEYRGDSYIVVVQFKEHSLRVAKVGRHYEVGDDVRFGFDSRRLLYFDRDSGRNLLAQN